jgi:hypothetical protein
MAVPGRGITRSAAALGTQENKSLDNGGRRAVGKGGEGPSGGTCNNTIPLPLAVSWSPRRILLPRPEPGISEKAENLGSLCSLGLPSRAQTSDDGHDAGMANKSPEFNWSRNTRHPMFRATSP